MLIALCLLTSVNLYAIRQSTAQFVSAGVGTAAAAIGGLGCSAKGYGPVGSLLGSFLSGGIGGGLTYLCLYWFTPNGRMRRAKARITKVRANSIATSSLGSKERILNAVREQYIISDVYLACACHDLANLLTEACEAAELLECACKDTSDQSFTREAQELIWFTRQAISRITAAIKIIRDCPDYAKQLRIQEERRIELERLQLQRERIKIEREKVHAQERIAQAYAGSGYGSHVHLGFNS